MVSSWRGIVRHNVHQPRRSGKAEPQPPKNRLQEWAVVARWFRTSMYSNQPKLHVQL
jgi:hypothetical protein